MSGPLDALDHAVRRPRGDPDGALVLLHGRGADERDLQPLLDELDPERRLLALTPRGPLALAPGGAHWYAVRRVGFPDPATFSEGVARLGAWLDALPDAVGVPHERIVLGGFSQGAVMAYALGLARGRPRSAGIVALSGFIPTVEGFALDLEARRGLPVAIGHGTHDPVIDVAFAREARERLERAGARVLYRETPMFHGIDPVFVHILHNWLADAVPAAAAAASAEERSDL
jgi:phospholipase/carboxylesterase